jgi:predicted nucleic acid-binding protein
VIVPCNVKVARGGHEYEVLRKAFESEFELLISPAIIAELEGVLSKKFSAPRGWIEEVTGSLTANSTMIDPKHRLRV